MQRDDAREDGLAAVASLCILGHNTRPNLNLLPEAENTGEDGTTRDTALELVDLRTRLIDIEGTDNDQPWV